MAVRIVSTGGAARIVSTGGAQRITEVDAIQTGADPAVLTLSFDVAAYAATIGKSIPSEVGITVDPQASPHNAVGDGVADDTTAMRSAISAIPTSGGVLDVSGGIYAVFDNSDDVLKLGTRDNITIKGGGIGTGFRSHPSQVFAGSRFDAILRLDSAPTANNCVFRDFEIDCNDNAIGGITTQNDDNTWIFNIYVHDIGGTAAGDQMPNAAIKGVDIQDDWTVIGCLVERTFGNLPTNSGCRGIWTTGSSASDVGRGAHVAHNIVRETGHTGIICHGDLPLNVIQFNTVFQIPATDAGTLKPEVPGSQDNTWNPFPNITQLWRRNYATGGARWPMQPETMGIEIRENLFVNWQQGPSTFSRFRYVIFEDNVVENWTDYGLFIDTNASNPGDRTNLFIRNNTFDATPNTGIDGVRFASGFTNARDALDNGDPIEVVDNKVVSISGNVVTTTADLDAYGPFVNTGNGPSGVGARNVLLPPTYV